jgi:hypothetical protein
MFAASQQTTSLKQGPSERSALRVGCARGKSVHDTAPSGVGVRRAEQQVTVAGTTWARSSRPNVALE